MEKGGTTGGCGVCYNVGTGRGKEVSLLEEKRRTIAREIISRREVDGVLNEHNISGAEFVEWLEDGELAAYLRQMAIYSAMAQSAEVWKSLKLLADSGDQRAIKLYLELCGQGAADGGHRGVMMPDPAIAEARRMVFGDE